MPGPYPGCTDRRGSITVRGRFRRAASDPVFEPYSRAFLAARTPGAAGFSYPGVAVYKGAGASHSWIWFADLLERIGLFDVTFIDESEIFSGALDNFDFLLIGGGDTYAMAEHLGERGARAIHRFVEGGGLYMGSCAGAYLVLSKVDLEPFTPFRVVQGNMLNVMDEPPEPRCLEHKYLARYGEEWVFHPVYGEVLLDPGEAAEGFPCFKGGASVSAPLFGGPVLCGAEDDEVLARFGGLTDRAAFLWPRQEALRLIGGRPAVLLSSCGGGTAMASGPHLEHPLFPPANTLAAEVFLRHCRRVGGRPQCTRTEPGAEAARGEDEDAAGILSEIKRQVSNARIVGFGLEKMPVTWRIGLKVWEPEKVRMFLDYAWDRLPYVGERASSVHDSETLGQLARGYSTVTDTAKSLKIKVESGEDSQAEAISLLGLLKELTATFLSIYFRLRLEERASDPSSTSR